MQDCSFLSGWSLQWRDAIIRDDSSTRTFVNLSAWVGILAGLSKCQNLWSLGSDFPVKFFMHDLIWCIIPWKIRQNTLDDLNLKLKLKTILKSSLFKFFSFGCRNLNVKLFLVFAGIPREKGFFQVIDSTTSSIWKSNTYSAT